MRAFVPRHRSMCTHGLGLGCSGSVLAGVDLGLECAGAWQAQRTSHKPHRTDPGPRGSGFGTRDPSARREDFNPCLHKSKQGRQQSKQDLYEPKQEPQQAKQDPFEPKQDTFEPKQEPQQSKQDPFELKQEPQQSKRDPFESKQELQRSKQDPLESRHDPMRDKQDPCGKCLSCCGSSLYGSGSCLSCSRNCLDRRGSCLDWCRQGLESSTTNILRTAPAWVAPVGRTNRLGLNPGPFVDGRSIAFQRRALG